MDNDNGAGNNGRQQCGNTSPTPRLPAPPQPENDTGIIPPIKSPSMDEVELTSENVDIFTLQPVAALKLLCRSIDHLVRMTGDVPPTPPIRSRHSSPTRIPLPPQSSLRHSSSVDYGDNPDPETPKKENRNLQPPGFSMRGNFGEHEHIDGVKFTKTPIGSPEAHAHEPSAGQIIAEYAEPVHIQHGAIARKFYSKKPPPISTEDYLMRMHKYCPMSTAVYLATSYYITRMAIRDRLLPVTPRNVHRLLLAGLRVAMKALEDLSWPHGRFSKVGGVSEGELGRLEITFCFLMNFSLKVDEAMLQHEAETLLDYSKKMNLSSISDYHTNLTGGLELRLPSEAERKARTSGTGTPGMGGEGMKRKASSALPSRPAAAVHVGGGMS